MLALIARPLSWRESALAGSLLLAAGALYCFGYNFSQGLVESPLLGLAWSVANLLPWLGAFELAKRAAGAAPRGLPAFGHLAGLVAGAALLSFLLELAFGLIEFSSSPGDLLFQVLRRVPGAALVLFLLILAGAMRVRRNGRARPAAEPLPLLAHQVDWIKAAGNYLEFHCAAGMVLRRMTLAQAEAALAADGFVRIHRSILVNASRIVRLRPGKLADEVELDDGTRLRVGGAYRSQLRRIQPRRAA
jgi:hypothetical protein